MTRTWTIIAATDVRRSFTWYQVLFGQAATKPAHDYWGQILDADGTVLLCLHAWGAHDHPPLDGPVRGTPGNGLLLFFCIDDFDAALERARRLVMHFEQEPHVNPATQSMEFSLRDPDGYYVTVSAFSATQRRTEPVDVDEPLRQDTAEYGRSTLSEAGRERTSRLGPVPLERNGERLVTHLEWRTPWGS